MRRTLSAIGVAGVSVGVLAGCSGSPAPAPTVRVTTTATATETATATVEATVTATPTVVKTIATRTHTVTVTYTPKPKPAVSDGTYKVGTDIKAGEYRTADSSGTHCYWERDSNLSGSLDAIIANDNIDGPSIIDVNRGEYVKFSGGCDWRRS